MMFSFYKKERKWYELNVNKGQQAELRESYTKHKWIIKKSETKKTIAAISIPASVEEFNVVLTQETIDFFQGILCPCETGTPCKTGDTCVANSKTAYSCFFAG